MECAIGMGEGEIAGDHCFRVFEIAEEDIIQALGFGVAFGVDMVFLFDAGIGFIAVVGLVLLFRHLFYGMNEGRKVINCGYLLPFNEGVHRHDVCGKAFIGYFQRAAGFIIF